MFLPMSLSKFNNFSLILYPVDFGAIYNLFLYLLTFLLNFLTFFPYFLLFYTFLLIYFLTCLRSDLSIYFFQNRPVLFSGRRS